MNLKYTLTIILGFIVSQTFAQFTLSGELRPRTEFKNGYKTLNPENVDPALATSQRTRLNFNYDSEFYSFYASVQDVRVWGDVSQLNVSDKNGLAIHEAWGLVNFKGMKLKAGRQEIVYDDHRIFGNVGWAPQARSHDAVVFKFGKSFKLDIGLAFNQNEEKLAGTIYTVSNNYKALQYAWFHKDYNNFNASFLFLNNGLQYIDLIDDNDEIRYSQTIGTHLKYKFSDALNASSNLYYQFGKDVFSKDVEAYLLGMNLAYKASEKWNLGVGFEIQSGNAYNDDSSTNYAFTPFYGTNHKFNGFMDYFYVGNHINSTGLIDVFASASTKVGDKSNLSLFLHNFNSQAEIAEDVEKQLGTEIDIVYNYKYTKDVTIGIGYSQMFATEGMEVLKNVSNSSNVNNWAWVMLTINPTLFTSK